MPPAPTVATIPASSVYHSRRYVRASLFGSTSAASSSSVYRRGGPLSRHARSFAGSGASASGPAPGSSSSASFSFPFCAPACRCRPSSVRTESPFPKSESLVDMIFILPSRISICMIMFPGCCLMRTGTKPSAVRRNRAQARGAVSPPERPRRASPPRRFTRPLSAPGAGGAGAGTLSRGLGGAWGGSGGLWAQ